MKINADMKNYKWESKALVMFDIQVSVPVYTETSVYSISGRLQRWSPWQAQWLLFFLVDLKMFIVHDLQVFSG